MAKTKESALRIRLEEPEYFRKDILEGAEFTIFNLKSFDNLKVLKGIKHELTDKLMLVLKDIHKDLNKVKRDMPKLDFSEGRVDVSKDHRFVSGVDKELDEIRNRLDNLKV